MCVRNDVSGLLEVRGKREGRINTYMCVSEMTSVVCWRLGVARRENKHIHVCVRNDVSVLLEVRGKREGRINTYMCVSEMTSVVCWRLGGSEKGE